MTNLYEQYINGNTDSVWDYLIKLGAKVVEEPHQEQTNQILKIIGERIQFNLKTIYEGLVEYGYVFSDFKEGLPTNNKADSILILNPNPDYSEVDKLNKQYASYGQLPLLFSKLLEVVKEVNYCGYFPTWKEEQVLLDPIVIYSIDGIIALNDDTPFDDDGMYCIVFSPDEYLKEDISGGAGYGICLKEEVSVDGKLSFYLDDKDGLSLMDYLRLCFKWAGFPALEWQEDGETPSDILHIITEIRKNLLPI